MDVKKLLLMLGFKPKDNAIAVYSKISCLPKCMSAH